MEVSVDLMNSKVIRSASVEALVGQHPWRATPDYKAMEEQIYQVTLKHKKYGAVETIAVGDIAALTLVSETKKFNRKLKLQVGANMFDRELEAALVGGEAGKTFAVSHSAGQITCTVEAIQRLVVPALTDEMAQKLQIEGISTAAALKEHYLQESLKKQLLDEVFDFIPAFLDQWEVAIDEQDLIEMDEHEMERCRGISRSMGQVFDEMTEEQLLGAVGCRNIPEFRAMIHEYHKKTLRALLAEAYLSGQDVVPLTPADANPYYGALMDRIVLCALQQMKEKETC